jgi:class 3 adenylate cyclase/tetratricopeptide (TPR) repeat protein
MQQIAIWLNLIGLGQYAQRFAENDIDVSVLRYLTDQDLEKLGVSLGHRRKMLAAILELREDATAMSQAAAQPDQQAEAERRQLTVMFCDLVGSTALSTRLDPEDMRAVINAYQAACARIMPNYEGFIAGFRGDGILAYFGYPRAHEDNAERAVRAALDIVKAVARLETRAATPLSVRIGIATGVVVVEGASREYAVVGETPNLAARLQALAEPGSVVVAESTRRLLGDLFYLRELGHQPVKGISAPIAAWAVEGLSDSDSRFEAVRAANRTELFGRKDEIKFLVDRQRLAWRGEGQIVLISGEPGIGKSRIATSLGERTREPHTYLRYQCSSYHVNSALYPFIAQLERAAGFSPRDTPEQKLDKLEAFLALTMSGVQEVARLFAAALSIPFGERYPPLTLSPTQQRRRTLAALLDHLEGLAHRQPVLMLFEDAHWADATTLELLDLIVERVRQLRILGMFTLRPEFEPPWVALPNVGTLTLGRLDRSTVESMVARLTRGYPLPAEVMEQIVAKTDGNPLFVEELTKAVLETGLLVKDEKSYRLHGPLPPLAIPATLHDSLVARLDRLAPAKEIAQIGAAIGREFSYSLLRALVQGDETTLKVALTLLEQAELVFRRGQPPETVYIFKHALVQDAAYESLLKSRRQVLHQRIAETLRDRFPTVAGAEPEIVAHHFTQAGLAEPAIDYWLKAGQLALSRSANIEAVKHLKQGIEMAQSQVPSPQRPRKELEFYLALGPAMAATEGFARPGPWNVFSRARELLGDGGTPTERMTVLWGAYLAHSMQAEHAAALDVARQCLKIGGHPGISALGNRFTGQTLSFMGKFIDARLHLEESIALCAAHGEPITDYRKFGTDDQVTALAFLAPTLLLLGYPEQSAATAEQAVSRAKEIGLAFTIALALSQAAFLGTLGGDPQRAAAFADETIHYCDKHGLADPAHRARFTRGTLLAQSGDPQRGIEIMRDAIVAPERRTLYLGHLASAHASVGEPEVGLGLVEEALQTAEITGEKFFEAELYRLRSNILLMLGITHEAEAGLRRALTIAQEQQARWWELRAAVSLAKFWRSEGKYQAADSILRPVYAWFIQDFDATDLKEAKSLLNELRLSI